VTDVAIAVDTFYIVNCVELSSSVGVEVHSLSALYSAGVFIAHHSYAECDAVIRFLRRSGCRRCGWGWGANGGACVGAEVERQWRD